MDVRIPILDHVDLFAPAVKPQPKRATGNVTRYTTCPNPHPDYAKSKPTAHYITGEMGHWSSGLHKWDFGRRSGKGYDVTAEWRCETCNGRYGDIMSEQRNVPFSTAQNGRGVITNIEFCALYLLQQGPTSGKDLLEALGRWRDQGGPYRSGSGLISPEATGGTSYADKDGVRFCGNQGDDCYWYREPAKPRQGNKTPLHLTDRGLKTAMDAILRVLAAAGIPPDAELMKPECR